MNMKKFIPCIYLYKGNAIKGFNDTTPVSMNPKELANYYCQNNADELILFDLSTNDTEHDQAIGIIKQIVNSVEIPVIGAGNVKRMEDIKKLIYAGCYKAVVNFSKDNCILLTEEVSSKFGKDKIIASVKDIDELMKYQEEILSLCDSAILLNCVGFHDKLDVIKVPIIGILPEIALNKVFDFLDKYPIAGISGQIVNDSVTEILALKKLCIEKGIDVMTTTPLIPWSELKKNSDDMVPVVTQDYKTNQVLMVAYMNEEAYNATLASGKMTYYSRSRKELWLKGETSGHFQFVKELISDCDKDTILAKVSQVGAACHTGNYSCFFNEIMKKEYNETNPLMVFEKVFDVIKDRKVHPKEGSYTNYLYEKGIDKILKKLGEEATEIVIAAKNPNPDEIKYEISDFLYHMMVLMAEKGVSWEDITTELAQR